MFVYSSTVYALQTPKVLLDGRELFFDVPPIIENGRILVPVRAIFEELGANLTWKGITQPIIASKGNTTIELQVGSYTSFKNGKQIILDVPPRVINDRTLVPLRFVSEALDAEVNWNSYTHTVSINSQVSEPPSYKLPISEKKTTQTEEIETPSLPADYSSSSSMQKPTQTKEIETWSLPPDNNSSSTQQKNSQNNESGSTGSPNTNVDSNSSSSQSPATPKPTSPSTGEINSSGIDIPQSYKDRDANFNNSPSTSGGTSSPVATPDRDSLPTPATPKTTTDTSLGTGSGNVNSQDYMNRPPQF
ncbi:copper amine oxidase N-terminal domain-containing protein [Heliomicrobium gestii]|uniref:copper amine oxidase N-terminal domain-containing protein n=1 Tax=Heliomicrobium gestii TaxID=2699 RepID=UPI00195754E0|nr:stalk domain-containing protein [Heliomicrobium gestii]